MPSDSLDTLHDLFIHELRDIYDAEKQLLKALPKMSAAAQSPELKEAFDNHLRETEEQVSRLEQVFSDLSEKPTGKSCKAMQGLVAESNELLGEDANPSVMDAALIVAAQKVEHYEIAGYGSVCTFGRLLGLDDVTELLKQNMAEEEKTDKLLTSIAERLNAAAESGEQSSEAGGGEGGMGANRVRASGGRQSSGGGNRRGRSSSRAKSSNSRTKSSGTRGRSTSKRSRSTARSRR